MLSPAASFIHSLTSSDAFCSSFLRPCLPTTSLRLIHSLCPAPAPLHLSVPPPTFCSFQSSSLCSISLAGLKGLKCRRDGVHWWRSSFTPQFMFPLALSWKLFRWLHNLCSSSISLASPLHFLDSLGFPIVRLFYLLTYSSPF